MAEYTEDKYILLSGIQHFIFCRRQWTLIHIEQLWQENYLTTDGSLFHSNAHDTEFVESRGDTIITRGVYLHSSRLGVSGQCDILEFRRSVDGITLSGRDGSWLPYPIEYKRGKPREDTGDAHQLCGQAMCLEEMLCCHIPAGALYYGEIKRRVEVEFTDELRSEVESALKEMHELFERGYTPKVRPKKGCQSCSMKELCLPKLMKVRSARDYMKDSLEEV
ncbi:MAG: CRISPR-associated protein Cas4 [Oscillospiraceae bacterium]|nr:CRISPR-associated protein Cas4 [Oscillospiraceae bacterium]